MGLWHLREHEGPDGDCMNGTFNGITLSQITSLNTTTEASGIKRTTFRVLGRTVPKLEQILQLNAPGLLITSSVKNHQSSRHAASHRYAEAGQAYLSCLFCLADASLIC